MSTRLSFLAILFFVLFHVPSTSAQYIYAGLSGSTNSIIPPTLQFPGKTAFERGFGLDVFTGYKLNDYYRIDLRFGYKRFDGTVPDLLLTLHPFSIENRIGFTLFPSIYPFVVAGIGYSTLYTVRVRNSMHDDTKSPRFYSIGFGMMHDFNNRYGVEVSITYSHFGTKHYVFHWTSSSSDLSHYDTKYISVNLSVFIKSNNLKDVFLGGRRITSGLHVPLRDAF